MAKSIYFYIFTFGIVVAVGMVGKRITDYYSNEKVEDEYVLIKKYLLNDSPLYGYNRPKLWIHTKYEVNSRKWKSFQSRNTTDLNQPYIHLTIKSIINHCGNDFNVCLIDDQTFSKLIPSWNIDMHLLAEPHKKRAREIGLMELVYLYGGVVVPNSFLCLKNLLPLYEQTNQKPFLCENINKTCGEHKAFRCNTFFMGAKKNDPVLLGYLEQIKPRGADSRWKNIHFEEETEFRGLHAKWWDAADITVIDGSLIGVKDTSGKRIMIEELTGEDFIDFSPDAFGIYIPEEEILQRPNYQWLSVLSSEEILASNLILAKYLKASLVDSYTNPDSKKSVVKSVVTI